MARKTNKKPTAKRPQSTILASATIKQGIDTDILQEDLIREFQPDRYNSDESYLINSKWVVLQSFRRLIKKLSVSDSGIEEMNSLITSVNLNGETLEEVIEKVAFDWWAFGNSIVELVKTTAGGKDIVYIYHIPLYKAAIKKANENNIVKEIGISENWDNQSGSDEGSWLLLLGAS